jgi:TP901 family phage tail tape measure protein
VAFAEQAQLAARLTLKDDFSPKIGNAQRGLSKLDASVGKTTGSLQRAHAGISKTTAAIAVGVGGAIGAVGLALKSSIGAAGDFESQLNTINTVAHVSQTDLKGIGDGLRQVARDSGKSLDELTAGYYDLVSAGIKPGAEAMKVLTAANTLAIGGLASTGETIDLLTTAINSYGVGTDQAAHITDVFAGAIAAGKTTAADLASSFAQVGPLAASAGISIEELGAAYGTMTASGVQTAQVTTDIRAAIIAVQRPTTAMAKLAKDLGINFEDIAKKKGLAVAMQTARDAAEKAHVPLIKVLGSVEAQGYALGVTGDKAAAYGKNLTAAQKDVGTAAAQAAERQKGFNYQMDRLRALAKDAGITIGSALLPKITPLIAKFNEFLTNNPQRIEEFATKIAGGLREDRRARSRASTSTRSRVGSQITGRAMQTIVSAFLALPPDVQKIAVAALAANKLSGGLVTSGIGSLLKLGLGGLKTITAGSVTVVGAKVGGAGVGGAATGAAGAATGTAGKVGSFLGKVAIVGEVIGLVAAVEGVRESIGAGNSALASGIHDQTTAFIASKPNNAALQSSLAGIDKGIADIQSNPLNVLVQGDALEQLKAMRADVANQLANNKVPTLGEHANDRTVAAVNKANATIGRGITEGHRDTDKLDGSVRRTPTEIAAAKRATVAATNAASASARANAARINAGIHSSSAANVGANHHLAAVTSNGLAHLSAEVNHTTSATKAASASARANAALVRAGIHTTGAATVAATHALSSNTGRGLAHLSGEVNRLPPRLARAIPKPKAPIVRLTVNQRISLKAVVSARSQHDVLVTASRYGAVYGSGNAL